MTRTKHKWRRSGLFALLAALALVAAACSSTTDTTEAPGEPATTTTAAAGEPATTTTAAAGGEEVALPGEGKSITMARADWSTGYFQAYIFQALLTELGYDVSDPASLELGPSLAYLGMAQGDFDFWANSWYPGHLSWHAAELPDGSKVGDHLTVVGELLIAGGLQGFLMTKTFADEWGITTLDDLNNNPDALAAFDAVDPEPNNGVADIYGCQESYTCDNIIQNILAFSGLDNITQVIAGYDAMAAEATAKADDGVAMVIYTWTPSAYITTMIPGQNVVWIGVEDVLDDSNPTGQEGGDAHDQRPGTANIKEDQCPYAATNDTCQLGWVAADIQVTANSEWLASEPAAAKMLELVRVSVIEVSLANVQQAAGKDSNADIKALADAWISANRGIVDTWVAESIAAG